MELWSCLKMAQGSGTKLWMRCSIKLVVKMKKKFPALEHLNYQRPPLLFMYEKDGSTLGVFTKKHEGYHCPIEYYSQQLSTALKYTIKY